MYVGLGDSTTDLSSVATAIAGTTPAAAPASQPCDLGWTYDPTSGVCVTLTTWQAVQDWLSTGSNALYAAGGLLALVVLGVMIGKR